MMKVFERMVCEAAVTGNRDLAVTALNMNLLQLVEVYISFPIFPFWFFWAYEQKLDIRLNGGWDCITNRSPKGKRKTKTVNQDVVKVRGLVNYPGRFCGQRIPVNFKSSDGTIGRKRITTPLPPSLPSLTTTCGSLHLAVNTCGWFISNWISAMPGTH